MYRFFGLIILFLFYNGIWLVVLVRVVVIKMYVKLEKKRKIFINSEN